MNNVSTINLPVSTFGNIDDILVNASGSAGRIKKVDFLGAMNDWNNITNKPFDAFNNTYFRTTERSDGADILTLSDSVIAYFDSVKILQTDLSDLDTKVDENYQTLDNKMSSGFSSISESSSQAISSVSSNLGKDISATQERVTALEGKSHTHNNKAVIDLFSTSDSKLLWNGVAVGSDYELPIATSSLLGGVKPDGITITVDSDGTIHGASQGLDFNALSTAMTTGTQSGITVTTDTENSRFNFEVTGVPTIAIDSEGYWTVEGERGENPTKAQGEKGSDGADGISPTAVVTDTGVGATITITDKNGTTTVDIYDGTDGVSPHIDSTTKHWFVGETDTGVIAEGVTTISTTSLTYIGNLVTDNWIGDTAPYTQTINITGITADNSPIIDLIVSDDIALGKEEITQWSYITKATTGENSIAFSCYEKKPSIALNFKVKVV